MQKEIWIGLYILLGIYLLYRIFLGKNRDEKEFEQLYDDILNSEKYKVKGQYEK